VVDGGVHAGVRFYFIDHPPFFDRDGIYGTSAGDFPDNALRYALFSRAVLEASKTLGPPDVFHCHDWQTALVPVLLRLQYQDDPLLGRVPIVFTIHNLGYQGIFPPDVIPQLLLPGSAFTVQTLEFFGKVNFLKGGLVFADHLTTVSRKYSQEIQTAEHGFALEGVVRERAAHLSGILNGVDYNQWSPENDPYIAQKYSAQDLSGKAVCKRDLLAEFGIADVDTQQPVIGIVSRFAVQKGFDLIAEVAGELAKEELRVVILGSGDRLYEDLFRQLHKEYPQKFAVKVAYDNTIAHKIEAGADMFLMPSRYEPCGLNQIYSLRYGTVPVVRATGGLDDTVEQWNPRRGTGTGFRFTEYTPDALLSAVRQALTIFKDQTAWQKIMRNGMAKDFSWNASAKEYERVFEQVRKQRGKSRTASHRP
jgi:starch synthase